MKTLLLLLSVALAPLSATAQFVNFANEGAPVSLEAFLYRGSDPTNLITGTNPGVLANGSLVSFDGTFAGASGLTLGSSLYDDDFANGIPGLLAQTSFYVGNYTGGAVVFEAYSLKFGVNGLYALGATLTSDFTFNYISIEGVTFETHYDLVTGTYYFTNSSEVVIPASSMLVVNGRFVTTAAVPEPSAYALIASAAALGFGFAVRRKRVRRGRFGSV